MTRLLRPKPDRRAHVQLYAAETSSIKGYPEPFAQLVPLLPPDLNWVRALFALCVGHGGGHSMASLHAVAVQECCAALS